MLYSKIPPLPFLPEGALDELGREVSLHGARQHTAQVQHDGRHAGLVLCADVLHAGILRGQAHQVLPRGGKVKGESLNTTCVLSLLYRHAHDVF